MSINVGSLIATIGVDIRGLKKGLKTAEGHLKDFSSTTKKEINKTKLAWKHLGSASTQDIMKMKAKATAAYDTIAEDAKSSAKDIERASSISMAKRLQIDQRYFNTYEKYLNSYVKKTKTALKKVNKEHEESSKKVNKEHKKSSTSITSDMKRIGSAVAIYFSATKIIEWGQAIVEAGVRIESVTNAFVAVTGSVSGAREELAFTATVAHDLGLNIKALEDSYKTLAAASINTKLEGKGARDVFYAVAEASTAMQLSATQTHSALYALQQMMSKGRVQTEELRRQLGEQLPGAFQMAAQAMGVTTAELNKMLEMGEVVSEDFLPKFAKVLHERFGKAAVKNAELARGAFNRFGNEVEYTKRSLANAGFTEFFADLARSATKSLEELSTNVEAREKDIREYMGKISDSFNTTIKNIDVGKVVEGLESVFGALQGIGGVFNNLVSLYQSAPEMFKGGIIIGMIGAVNPILGIAAGIGVLASEFMNFVKGLDALGQGEIKFSDFFGSEEDFEKAMNRLNRLHDLTDGVIETEEELRAAIELTRFELKKASNAFLSTHQKGYQESIELVSELKQKLKEYIALLPKGIQSQKAIDMYKNLNKLQEKSNGIQSIHNERLSKSVGMYKNIKQLQEDINAADAINAKAQGERNKQVKQSVDMYTAIRRLQGETERSTSRDFKKDQKSISDYIDKNLLSSKEYELSLAKEKYTERLKLAEKQKDNYIKIDDEYQSTIFALKEAYLAKVKEINSQEIKGAKNTSAELIAIAIKTQNLIASAKNIPTIVSDYGTDAAPGYAQKQKEADLAKLKVVDDDRQATEDRIEIQNAMPDTYGVDVGNTNDGLAEMQKDKLALVATFNDDYKRSTMTTTAYELDQLNQRYDEYDKSIKDKTKLDEWYALETSKIIEGTTNDWSDAFSGWANSYANDLNEMVWGAEMSFESIAESFGKMLTQMQMQKAMSGLGDWVDGVDWGGVATSVVGMFGGSSATVPNMGDSIHMAGGGVINEHVVGVGMSSGASYEFGEGGVPEAVIPSSNWGGGGGGTTVNIIDQRSGDAPAAETKTSQGPNGQQQIDILIKKTVQSSMSDGSLDKVMQLNYGAKRQGIRR